MISNQKKIIFAISDTGGGHRSAAAAMIATIDVEHDIQCTIVDLLQATAFPGLKQAPEIFDYCSINHLWLSNLLFRKTNSIKRINALTRMIYFHCRHHLEELFARLQPDMVIAVHPLVIGLLHLIRKMSNATWPIITVVTDLVTIHASWATPGADLYLVPTQEAFSSLLKYGIPNNRIIHTGFPIHPKFTLQKSLQSQARQELGLKVDGFMVLLTGGGIGAGNMREYINTIKKECPDTQLLIVTGKNKQLYNELLNTNKMSDTIHIYGFINHMEILMSASDVIVSKAGPGTIMEAITLKRPLVITEAVGIQETGNINYVINNCFGYYAPTPHLACKAINEIAKNHWDTTTIYSEDSFIKNGTLRISEIIQYQLTETTSTIVRGA
jgi:1,2-diacylglycerol 3-beta-galactosyltransferase